CWLASAFALKGETERAGVELADAWRLSGNGSPSSIAEARASAARYFVAPAPRIAGQPLPVTRPSASRPERLGRPGLSRPPAGLHQWRTIADARCSAQWTGRR